jgi:hypothetical protein
VSYYELLLDGGGTANLRRYRARASRASAEKPSASLLTHDAWPRWQATSPLPDPDRLRQPERGEKVNCRLLPRSFFHPSSPNPP